MVLRQTNIDTDQIIPARFLSTTERAGLGRNAFNDWRWQADGSPVADFAFNQPHNAGRSILLAGRNFGCGSSREHAPWALTDLGLRAIVSSEIADIFRGNSLKNGLLPIVLDEADVQALMQRPDDELTIDVAARELRTPDGRVYSFPLDGFSQTCLLEGVDQLGYLLGRVPESNVTRVSMHAEIVVLPGDGIGPEVAAAAVAVLKSVATRFNHTFTFSEHDIGGIAIDRHGEPLPASTLTACQAANAVLLGAVGGPKWSDPNAKVRPEQGLLAIRKALGLYANLRPVRTHEAALHASPIKAELLQGVDFVVVRELTGGIYFGDKTRNADSASDLCRYTVAEIERVLRSAFRLGRQRRGKVTSVDKANVLETSRLWRDVAARIGREEFPDVALEHQLVDSMAMHLLAKPREYDVIVTENMFGDILTDEASMLAGSLGLLPSASLGEPGAVGIYEPIHGSAPDIAGKGIANPYATIFSAAMLLRHSLGLETEAAAVEAAVHAVLDDGVFTADLAAKGQAVSTAAATDAVLANSTDPIAPRHAWRLSLRTLRAATHGVALL